MQTADGKSGRRTAPESQPGMAAGAGKPRPRVAFSQILGEFLLTLGALVLLFALYESFWTNIESGRQQDQANERLDDIWGDEDGRVNPRQQLSPELGDAFARMYIPSFGSDFHFAVMEGTNESELVAGPGHYPESQMSGQGGNFALAGHRVGKGAPFNDLGNLSACDALVVETATSWDVYRVMPLGQDENTRREEAADCFTVQQTERMVSGEYSEVHGRYITTPNHVEVIHPIPGFTDTEVLDGAESLITLTTCHPQFSAAERMIVHGMLVEQIDKTTGVRPAALEEI